MEAYLDNAATTRVFPEVRDIMLQVMEKDFGNPSSRHTKGIEAEGYVTKAVQQIAGTLKCQPKEIIDRYRTCQPESRKACDHHKD